MKQPLLIIRDGLKAHRSKLVREYLDSTEGAVQIAFLPQDQQRRQATQATLQNGRSGSSTLLGTGGLGDRLLQPKGMLDLHAVVDP